MAQTHEGKTAIVTGAGRGLGRAMALGLLGAGAQVLALPHHLGLGGCVQAGYRLAYELGYDYVIRVDGDGQRVVIDEHGRSAIDSLGARPRDHHGDGVADETHDLGRKWRASHGVGCREGGAGREPEVVRQEGTDDARHRGRGRHVHPRDARVGERRPYEHGVQSVIAADVVRVLSRAGDEPFVLAPPNSAPKRGAHGHGPHYRPRLILGADDRTREAMGSAALVLELPGRAGRDVD